MYSADIEHMPLLHAGRRIAADSCSLIFLNRLHLLEHYASVHTVVLTQALYDEITRVPCTTQPADERALYEKLFAGSVFLVNPEEKPGAGPRAALSCADRTLIHAFYSLSLDGILTDDKKVCLNCRTRNIPYINTPMALFVLLSNGVISHGSYTAALQELYGMGRYGKFVRDHMEELYRACCANKPVPPPELPGN